jgi:hypothetical protein
MKDPLNSKQERALARVPWADYAYKWAIGAECYVGRFDAPKVLDIDVVYSDGVLLTKGWSAR